MTRFDVADADFYHETEINSAGCLQLGIYAKDTTGALVRIGTAVTPAQARNIGLDYIERRKEEQS